MTRIIGSSACGNSPKIVLIQQAMKRLPALALRDYVRTETTDDMTTALFLNNKVAGATFHKYRVSP